jgi:urease accessory protein
LNNQLKSSQLKSTLLLAACMVALPALAHPGHADVATAAVSTGFAAGFAHPLSGIDHLLAMLGVGLWSRQQGRAGKLPLAFLAVMAIGAAVRVTMPALEAAIAASVALIGVLLVASVRLPQAGALAVVALCAFVHGAAHGQELAGPASTAGFLLATSVLLALGTGAGERVRRIGGAAIGAVGLGLLATLGLVG